MAMCMTQLVLSHIPMCTVQVVLSHSPMRQLVPEFGDRPVLVSGRGRVLEVSDGGRAGGARGTHKCLVALTASVM